MSVEGSGQGRRSGLRDEMDPPFEPDYDLITYMEERPGPDMRPWWRKLLEARFDARMQRSLRTQLMMFVGVTTLMNARMFTAFRLSL